MTEQSKEFLSYKDSTDTGKQLEELYKECKETLGDPVKIPAEYSTLQEWQWETMLTAPANFRASHEVKNTPLWFDYTMRIGWFDAKTNHADISKRYEEVFSKFLQTNHCSAITRELKTGIGTPLWWIKNPWEQIIKLVAHISTDKTKPKINTIDLQLDTKQDKWNTPTAGPILAQQLNAQWIIAETTTLNQTFAAGITIRTETKRNKPRTTQEVVPNSTSLEQRFAISAWAVEIRQQDENLTTEWSISYPIYLNNMRIWSIVKCEKTSPQRTPKAMFISSERSWDLFTKKANGDVFPNITAIQNYFNAGNNGKKRTITMISTGPTFQTEHQATMTGINYDNWQNVGHEALVSDPVTTWRWIATISGGQLTITHSSEIQDTDIATRIVQWRDIMTMSSAKRNNTVNSNASLRWHPHTHSIVQFSDGTRWTVVINNLNNPQAKQDIYKNIPQISRALYADSDRANDYLDGIWIQTKNQWLQYSNPSQGDLFKWEASGWPIMNDNMPGILVFFTEEQ